jgi:hypothetical protein
MKYHLLWRARDRSILLQSYNTKAEATLGQSWMLQFEPFCSYPICTFDAELNRFISQHDCPYQPVRGPYTKEAWDRICAEIGYVPPAED